LSPDPKNRRDLDLLRRAHPLYTQLMNYETALKEAEASPTKAGVNDLRHKVEQTKKQMEDISIKDEASKYGYVSKQLDIKTPEGKPYDRTALEELIRWRLWDRTGGGLMAELGGD